MESFLVSVDFCTRACVVTGTTLGVDFIQHHVDITKDFINFCLEKYGDNSVDNFELQLPSRKLSEFLIPEKINVSYINTQEKESIGLENIEQHKLDETNDEIEKDVNENKEKETSYDRINVKNIDEQESEEKIVKNNKIFDEINNERKSALQTLSAEQKAKLNDVSILTMVENTGNKSELLYFQHESDMFLSRMASKDDTQSEQKSDKSNRVFTHSDQSNVSTQRNKKLIPFNEQNNDFMNIIAPQSVQSYGYKNPNVIQGNETFLILDQSPTLKNITSDHSDHSYAFINPMASDSVSLDGKENEMETQFYQTDRFSQSLLLDGTDTDSTTQCDQLDGFQIKMTELAVYSDNHIEVISNQSDRFQNLMGIQSNQTVDHMVIQSGQSEDHTVIQLDQSDCFENLMGIQSNQTVDHMVIQSGQSEDHTVIQLDQSDRFDQSALNHNYLSDNNSISIKDLKMKSSYNGTKKHSKSIRHLNSKSKSSQFICNLCGNKLKSKLTLSNHMKTHEPFRPHQCEQCGMCFKLYSIMQSHKQTHDKNEKYSCSSCDFKCRSKETLRSHNFKFHLSEIDLSSYNEKIYTCDFCGKRTITKRTHLQHVRMHTGETPFKCEFCPKSFSCRSYLNYHLKLHSGLGHYCNACEKTFTEKRKYLRHIGSKRHKKKAEQLKKFTQQVLPAEKVGHKSCLIVRDTGKDVIRTQQSNI